MRILVHSYDTGMIASCLMERVRRETKERGEKEGGELRNVLEKN